MIGLTTLAMPLALAAVIAGSGGITPRRRALNASPDVSLPAARDTSTLRVAEDRRHEWTDMVDDRRTASVFGTGLDPLGGPHYHDAIG